MSEEPPGGTPLVHVRYFGAMRLGLAVAVLGAIIGVAVTVSEAPPTEAHGSDRKIVWRDEFAGARGKKPDSARWTYNTGGGGWGNGELQSYTQSRRNAHLDGRGHLVISAIHERHTGPDGRERRYTSARLKTEGKFAFRYGQVAARIRVPSGRGLWPAFWMLGANYQRVGYPRCGEIDVMELVGNEPRKVHAAVHGPGPHLETGIGGGFRARRSLAHRYHVYAARWSPNAVRFSIDGRTYETVHRRDYPRRDRWVFNHRMFLIVNLAVGGDWPGPPTPRTRFPARLRVDWVRVWR